MKRFLIVVGAIALGAACAIAAPDLTHKARAGLVGLPGFKWLQRPTADSPRAEKHHEAKEGTITLAPEQIAAAGVSVGEVGDGELVRSLSVPGAIVPSGDRVARVAVKVLGTVAELRKRLGETVEQGEVVAVIESREVADAKSEYLATRLTHELQQTLAERAKRLVDIKAMAENEYLRTRNAFEDARVRWDVARQKLAALGMTEQQIAELPGQPIESLRLQELRAPIAGKIAERRVDLGALVGREGQESELFVIVDLAEVWAELAISASDLPSITEGQEITVAAAANTQRTPGRITFISPLLDKETRAARVVATLANRDHRWRPGALITAEVLLEKQHADIVIPKAALQSVGGAPVVFVRSDEGFEKRKVATGREDERSVEITAGLSAGEKIAIRNTFILKAELGKGEAEHQD
jgi:cobalt-zinc-cadmium efflux system membrane fusion protein